MTAPVMLPKMQTGVVPTKAEAEAAWRRLYVDRMVEVGIGRELAQATGDEVEVDLSVAPADAADDELSYWEADQ